MRKFLLIFFVVIVVLFVLTMSVLQFFHNKITFQRHAWPVEKAYEYEIPAQEIWLNDSLGNPCINGVFVKSTLPSKGLILYFHGNRGNLQRWSKMAKDFTPLGFDFFVIDYPGYGKSKGEPSEETFYRSAEMAYDWARISYDPKDIVIYGRSIGSGPSSYLASKYEARQLILETPFASFPDLYRKHWLIKWFPLDPLVDFPVISYMENITIPIAIFMGTKDRVVPNQSTIELKQFVIPPSNFIRIKNGRHNNLAEYKAYHDHLKKILLGLQ